MPRPISGKNLGEQKVKVIETVCKNCGYHWETNPLRWRNMQFVNRKGNKLKILRCPACGTVIGLTKQDVSKILKNRNELLKLKLGRKRG